jgi:hypothetical protein
MIYLLDECFGKMKAMKIFEVTSIIYLHRKKTSQAYLRLSK